MPRGYKRLPSDIALELMEKELPACWTWRPPTAAAIERLQKRRMPAAGWDEQDWRWILMAEWQKERCAICSLRRRLVEDHDHETGLVRGLLCYSCNNLEPRRDGMFAKYRLRNPAMICGVRRFYVDPWTKLSAEPESAA